MFKHHLRILLSLGVILFLTGLVIQGTTAVMSDVETSSNTFTAGFIDLQIGAECSFKVSNPALLPATSTCPLPSTFASTNLGPLQKFFDYGNLEPGDFGATSIAIKPLASDAWGRMRFINLANYDNVCTEPEILSEPACNAQGTSTIFSGELQNNGTSGVPVSRNILFKLWVDEGGTAGFQCDGVRRCAADPSEGNGFHELIEPVLPSMNGLNGTAHFTDNQTLKISDILKLSSAAAASTGEMHADGHMNEDRTYFIGISWDLPSTANNAIQTDSFIADILYEVQQYNHNTDNFVD